MSKANAPRQSGRANKQVAALEAALAWNMVRLVVNGLRSARNSHRCELASRGEPEVGDLGVAPCWHGSGEDACDSCRLREPIHAQLIEARRVLAKLRQKMQRALNSAPQEQ